VSIELGRRLVAAGVLSSEELEAALFLAVVRGISFPRALIDRGVVTERGLEEELGRRGGLGLRNVVAVAELMGRLPPAMCRRLAAVPTRLDPYTGTVDVAAADPLDPHVAAEFGFQLGAPVRMLRASLAVVEEAIRRVELDESTPRPGRTRRVTPAFPHGAPRSSPPPADDVPIPLVRRAGVALVDRDEPEPTAGPPLRARGMAPTPSVSFPSTPPAAGPGDQPAAWSIPPPPALPGEITDEPGPPPVPTSEADELLAVLSQASNRDDVVHLALHAARVVARRVAVFVARRDGFHGWACTIEFGAPEVLRALVVPLDVPSVLATAAATGLYLGPIPRTSAHEALTAIMGPVDGDVAVTAVRVGGRPAMLLVADGLDDPPSGTRFLDDVARAAGEALTRLLKG
jgi:hypothetical protein